MAKQTSKKITTLAAASVMAFSGLALAAPMFFSGSAAAAQSSTLLINEVFPSPDQTSQYEWVEVYNASSSVVSLSGWDISTPHSDFSASATVANNCSGSVPAHGYCVFTNGSHSNSQQLLYNSGDTLTLSNGSLSDSVSYSSISSSANQSWARTTNGGSWGVKNTPTMGTSNDPTAELSVCAANCDTTSLATAISGISSYGSIYISPGTYQESATLTASHVTITGAGQGSTFIKAPATLPAEGTILTVSGNNAEISNLTVEGPGPSGCGSLYSGIYVKNAAGVKLHDLTVTDIADNTDSGCQNGIGIQVGRAADSSTGSATIDTVTVSGYQKAGIAVDNSGSSASITGSTITGVGAVSYIAQNGVQFSRGATGSISGSSVSNNECNDSSAGCGSDPMNDTQSVGVLLYQAGDVTVSGNDISSNDIGVYSLENGTGTISGNTLSGNRYEGLMFDQGSSTASGNTITGGDTGVLAASFSGNTDNTRVALGSDNTVSGATTNFQKIDQNTSDSFTVQLNSPSEVWVNKSYTTNLSDDHFYGWDAFSKVQDGANAVTSGGTVTVAAGDYTTEGTVSVGKAITINGAQAGIDARTRSASSQESTVVGFSVTNANVTIDGFKVDPGSDGQDTGIRFSGTNGSNAVRNSIITDYASSGVFWATGTGTFDFSHNALSGTTGSDSDGFQVQNGVTSSVDSTFENNTFSTASVGGADLQLSFGSATGTVVNGNVSTGGATLVTLFNMANSQVTNNRFTGDQSYSGSIVYVGGNDQNVTISDNVMSGSAGGAIAVSNAFGYGENSDVTITGNTLTGSVRGLSIGTGSIADSDTIIAHQNQLAGNTLGARNLAVGYLDASSNWWGNALGPDSSQYSGNVTIDSWCSVSDCSATQTASSGTTSLPSGPISTPTVIGSTSSVTIPPTNSVVAATTTTSGTVQVTIPAGTTVTADNTSWDGTIEAPTVTSVSLGSSKDVSLAIEVGAGNTSLTFNNAVRLVLPGQAGKSVGFVRNNVFTAITDTCSADSQAVGDALAAGGNCYINVGSDLVVWTKHFTTFVAYSPVSGSSSSSSSSSNTSGSKVVTTSSTTPSSSNNGSGAGSVQGESASTSGGQTSSTSTKQPALANLSQPKVAAKEAGATGLRWYWIVIIAIVAVALAAVVAYRYAEGTDEA